MKIGVFGAGGIGGYFGGRLAAAGHDVTFIARGAHLEAIRREGLTVSSVAGDFTVAPASATDDPAQVGPVDVVLLGVKTWQLGPAIAALPAMLGPGTAVLTTQNGVEAPARVAAAVGESAVLPGIAKIFSQIEAPGRIRHSGGPADLSFAEWDNRSSERVSALRTALTDAHAVTTTPTDIWAELWSKFLFIVPFGSLGAALDATIGDLRGEPRRRSILEDAMREIKALAAAQGVSLPPAIVPGTLAFVDDQPAEATASLQRDLVSDRPSELDAWTGAVVRLGEAAGVPVPIHRLLLELLTTRHPNALPYDELP